MSLIIATHYAYTDADGHNRGETRRFGTLTAARAWATRVLPTVVTTNDTYHRDIRRSASVELTLRTPTRRGADRHSYVHAGYVEAPIVIVPSVGELGWSP